MPVLNFRSKFVPAIESGLKRQTIRSKRTRGNPKPGDTLYLYTGMRGKNCKRIATVQCKRVCDIQIENQPRPILIMDGVKASNTSVKLLAENDGFDTVDEFYEFFRFTYGLPFDGLLIWW